MERFGKEFEKRRSQNAAAVEQAFGIRVAPARAAGRSGRSAQYRTIRAGGPTVIFTIGYEKRDGEGLMAALMDAGIELLADIRAKPLSRVPDFRAAALRGLCRQANIEYRNWPDLGSTEMQRENLRRTGDFKHFGDVFRRHVIRNGRTAMQELAQEAKKKSTSLLCYERLHEECHRSVVADILAKELDAEIVAI